MKTLFALSRNVCFFNDPDVKTCEERLTDPRWRRVKARIAHIRGEHPGSARYDPDQPDPERQGFENLLLLCPGCHTLIDELEPDAYPVERLQAMKERHLAHHGAHEWATEEQLVRYAALAIAEYHRYRTPASPPLSTLTVTVGAQLEVVHAADGGIDVVNVGDEPAPRPELAAVANGWTVRNGATITPAVLDPGETWRAGYLPSDAVLPAGEPYRVEVSWDDATGARTVRSFEL